MNDDYSPPTEQSDFDEFSLNEAPKWPKVVGIISIVIASLSLTCVGCGIISIAVFIPMGESAIGEPLPDPMKPGAIAYAMMGLGLVLAVVLVFAGISTILRKRSGWALHLVWALVSIPLSIGNAIYQFGQQQAAQDWIAANPDSPWAQQGGGQNSALQAAGLLIGLVLGLAYPVFCVIWSGLVKNKHEHMTGGVEEVF